MFKKVFIENDIKEHPQTLKILEKLNKSDIHYIESYSDTFGRVKKPYLEKRTNLNLYIATKKGQLLKETPPAYGLSGDKHYYHIHGYNCIYECDYCYLQGYFNSPDLVFFVNHNDIINEMKSIAQNTNERVWFHAGEFSDSLALSHITSELEYYFDFLKDTQNALIELRTKSVNTKELKEPLENLYVTYSLSPSEKIKKHDLKTPPLKSRLHAIKDLYQKGFKIGIHLDPIIYSEDFKEKYIDFLNELNQTIPIHKIEYISVGVVRFTKDVWYEVEKNYPKSNMHKQELVKSENGLVRYNRPMRLWMLNFVKDELLKYKIDSEKVYLCMED